jgi:hypothetical protein
VRLSKGAGTPLGWPDVLGLAVRVHDDRAGDADLLLSSTAGLPLLRHLPVPAFTFGGTHFGSLLALRAGPAEASRRVYLDAVGDGEPGTFRLHLSAAEPSGPFRTFAVLHLGSALPSSDDRRIAFDPTVGRRVDLGVAGAVQRLRGAVYRASQHGRPSEPDH